MALNGYNPDVDMPNLRGKVILVTGGTNGLGRQSVLQFAKHSPQHIYFTGRSQRAGESLMTECKSLGTDVTFLRCDQGSLDSIRQAADRLASLSSRLDIVVANAGIMAVPAELTSDGYEIQFGVNHIGNSALVLHMLPVMLRTATADPKADVRIIVLTSTGYMLHTRVGIDFDTIRTTQASRNTWTRYAQSKLANIVFAQELARRYPQITSVAVHPGVTRTDLVVGLSFWSKMLVYVTSWHKLITPRQGCYNTIWAATSAEVKKQMILDNGDKVAFFEPVGKANMGDSLCKDESFGKRLWDWTIDETGIHV